MLGACSGESTQEKIHQHMEESVKLEDDFVAQQQPLSELEQEEQALYQEISDLSIDEFEKINELAEKAIESIETRRDHIQTELASIEASKEEFDQVSPLIEELEDEALQTTALEVVELMEERYNSFLALHDVYDASLDLDVELYQLLMKEDLEEPEFTEQIEKVNAQYEKIIDTNLDFNEATDAFNQKKREFYEQSDLNVTYE
nr:YkyA family protein [Amphibacillus sp. MSJ-3]